MIVKWKCPKCHTKNETNIYQGKTVPSCSEVKDEVVICQNCFRSFILKQLSNFSIEFGITANMEECKGGVR